MKDKLFPRFRVWLLFLVFVFGSALQSRCEDLYLVARLIWGTNEKKTSDPKHFLINDESMGKKLRNVFAWTNYYEINRQNVMVPNRGTNQCKMSSKCTIEITELAGPKVEVKLIGEGKPINKTVKALSQGEYFVIAGEAKDKTAWFVIISQVDKKEYDRATATNQVARPNIVKTNAGKAPTEKPGPKKDPPEALSAK